MRNYTKVSLVVLYLFQVYMIFGEQIVETYHHVMGMITPPAVVAREIVAHAVLRRQAAASPTGQKMLHPALGIFNVPAALTLVLRDAHVVHPAGDDDGPEDKDRPEERRKRRAQRGPPNLWSAIKKFKPPPGCSLAHVATCRPSLLFAAE